MLGRKVKNAERASQFAAAADLCILMPGAFTTLLLVRAKGPKGAEGFQYHYHLSPLRSNKSKSNASLGWTTHTSPFSLL